MPTPRSGLGRGLAALLPDAEGAAPGGAALQVPVDAVSPNPYQPRREFEPEALAELTESIRVHGLLQPITVRPAPSGQGYQLIAGERRLRAAQAAGLPTVPALVRPCDERELVELALVENLQRADLNPIEAAQAYRRCLDEFGYTQEQLAERVGKSRAAVANTLRLLKLPESVRTDIAEGRLSEGHGRALLALPDEAAISGTALRIVNEGLSVREAEVLCRQPQRGEPRGRIRPAPPAPRPTSDADWEAAVARLERALGAKVELRRGPRGAGTLTVSFYSDDDLTRLLDQLSAP